MIPFESLLKELNRFVPTLEFVGLASLGLSGFIKLSRETIALVKDFIECKGIIREYIKRKRGRK